MLLQLGLSQADEKVKTFLRCANLIYECQLMGILMWPLATSPKSSTSLIVINFLLVFNLFFQAPCYSHQILF